MNAINTLESKLARLYKRTPNLPQNYRRWIAVNAWWIILLIAILTSLVLLIFIPGIFGLAGSSAYKAQYPYSTISVGTEVAALCVSVALGFVSVILFFLAVTPLKELRRKGWTLLFINQLIGVVAAVLSFLILIQNFNLVALVWALILSAVELYFLFQVRDEFSSRVGRAKRAQVIDGTGVKRKTAAKKKPTSSKKK